MMKQRKMNRIFVLLVVLVGMTSFQVSERETSIENPIASIANPVSPPTLSPVISGEIALRTLFDQFPQGSISWEAFEYAMLGRQYLLNTNAFSKENILTIVDFSKPSTEKRLFVIDVEKNEIIYASLTSHGRNSGENMATKFSNRPESYQSSLGFFKTGEIYYGSKGFSMRLDGLESNINCKARPRGIVVHAADYVSESFVKNQGRLGRSQGCPALPKELNKPIIQKIEGGSLFFIYAPNEQYQKTSKIIQSTDIHAFQLESSSEIAQG